MPSEVIPAGADNSHALHALARKRAEIAGQVDHHQGIIRRLVAELEHVDATIHLFNPAVDIAAIRNRKPAAPYRAAYKGEMTGVALDALREATRPLPTRMIALRVLHERGLDPCDRKLVAIMVNRMSHCLRHLRRKGMVRNERIGAGATGWALER